MKRRPRSATPLDGDARAAWKSAQALWGVHMNDAHLWPGAGAEHGAPAWFTFPPAITVDPEMVAELGAADELESVFGHELGHHALAPSTRIDALKIRHQLARALAAAGAADVRDDDLAFLSNLWTDLLVNTRLALLQRRRDGADAEPGIVRASRSIYRSGYGTRRRVWWVYLRAYELLWNLRAGTLCAAQSPAAAHIELPRESNEPPLTSVPERFREKEEALRAARREAERIAAELDRVVTTHPEVDADDVARMVRTFASDPVAGALRFGVIMAPYLVEEEKVRRSQGSAASPPGDGRGYCSSDHAPATAEEIGRVLADRRLHGAVPSRGEAAGAHDPRPAGDPVLADVTDPGQGQALGVARTLALYSGSDADTVLAAWYRTEAAPWVRAFTQRAPARPSPELPGPLESWETGDDLADLDWSATLQAGPVVVPGITTRQRSFLDDDPVPAETGIELDLYIDSSGSMRNPEVGSPAVLAGTVLALSVLRGGGRVRVTSFSGPGQVAGSAGFTRNHVEVVTGLADYFGGGTTFPLDLLAQRYDPLPLPRPSGGDDVRRHLVVLSDDGLVSMFGVGNAPFVGVASRVRAKLTTATLVVLAHARGVEALAVAAGYDMLYVKTMDDAPEVCARLSEVLHG